MAVERVPIDPDDLRQRYERGESILKMARELGVSRTAITPRLRALGLEIRGASEANRIRMAQLSPAERLALTSAAHRGRRREIDLSPRNPARHSAMVGTAERQTRKVGKGEAELVDLLVRRGIEVDTQVPVYGYNLDLASGRVAVEVWWGEGYPVRHGHQARRAIDLADLGWHVAWVWLSRRMPTETCADELVTFLDFASGRPDTVRPEYRVIRGDGQLVAGGQLDTDHLALVPPA